MNTEQAPFIFNFLLPISPFISSKELSSLAFQPISPPALTKLIADFISSEVPLSSNSTQTICSSGKYHTPNKPERALPSDLFKSLEKMRNKLFVNYTLLSKVNPREGGKGTSENAGDYKFLQGILVLKAYQDFNFHILLFIDYLSGLALKIHEETLTSYLHTLISSFDMTWWHQQCFWHPQSLSCRYKPSNLYNLLNTILNASLVMKNHFSLVFESKTSSPSRVKSKDFTFNNTRPFFSLSPGTLSDGASTSCSGALECLKSRICSDDCLEGELESHEEESTTSGSSRTSHYTNGAHSNAGEPEPTLYFLENGKGVSGIAPMDEKDIDLPQEIGEYYEGCFFGDLEIEFQASDKCLFEEEKYTTTGRFGYGYHGKSSYNNTYNQYGAIPYGGPQYGGNPMYQPKPYRGGNNTEYNNGYHVTYEPKKSPQPESDYKIINIPLFAIPTGGPAVMPINFNLINHGAVNFQGQLKPEVERKVSHDMTQLPLQNTQNMKMNPRKISQEQAENTNNNLSENKEKNSVKDGISSPPNLQTAKKEKSQKKNQTTTEKKSRKKKQGKGDLKLWDMISIKGKVVGAK